MKKHSLELKKKRLEKKIKRILFLFIFPFILLFSLFIVIFNSNYLAIKKVNVEIKNQRILEEKEILRVVNNTLEERYFGIFSKRNYIFYPSSALETDLIKNFSEIKVVDMQWNKFLNSINIHIEEDEDKYIFCQNNLYDNCFDISEDGRIFHKIKVNKNNKKVIFIYSDNKKGDIFFDSIDEEDKIISIVNFLEKNKKLKVKYFMKKNKYFYILQLKMGGKILLHADFKKDDIILKINKVLAQKGFSLKNIDYIDLTLKNRITYCIKGDICDGNY